MRAASSTYLIPVDVITLRGKWQGQTGVPNPPLQETRQTAEKTEQNLGWCPVPIFRTLFICCGQTQRPAAVVADTRTRCHSTRLRSQKGRARCALNKKRKGKTKRSAARRPPEIKIEITSAVRRQDCGLSDVTLARQTEPRMSPAVHGLNEQTAPVYVSSQDCTKTAGKCVEIRRGS
jgi:hypothetical protein